MTLNVYAARISVRDPDRLDITRRSAMGDGLAFAPSWAILNPALSMRDVSNNLAAVTEWQCPDDDTRDMLHATAGRIAVAMWALYSPAYVAEMRQSYRRDRGPWDRLIAWERVCLACYRTDAEHCHRRILGAEILPRLGAVWCGEVSP